MCLRDNLTKYDKCLLYKYITKEYYAESFISLFNKHQLSSSEISFKQRSYLIHSVSIVG